MKTGTGMSTVITCDRCGHEFYSNIRYTGLVLNGDKKVDRNSPITGVSFIKCRRTPAAIQDLCDSCLTSFIEWYGEGKEWEDRSDLTNALTTRCEVKET